MSLEDQLRSGLGDIRVPEALAPPADLADTVLIGMRRQARRRALVAAVSLVIAVVAAGATAPAWLSPRPGPGPVAPTEAPTDRACHGPLPTRPPSPTREYFDPLTSQIDVGAVPGYRLKTSFVSTYYQGSELINPVGHRTIMVIFYASGGEPSYMDANDKAVTFDPGAGEPAGSVGGAPAYWLPDKHFGNIDAVERGIAWRWTPGAWALVVAAQKMPSPEPGAPTADPTSTVDPMELRTIAAQVAPQVKLGVGTPVTAPFSMPQPDCTRLTVSLKSYETGNDGTPYTSFLLGFDTADKADFTHPPAGYLQPSLVVMADTGDAPKDVSSLTKYPEDLGYPAYQNEGLLSVYGVSGFAVNVWPFAMPNADTEAKKASLAADIFRTITIYPGAADSEAAWGDPIVP